MRISLNWLKDLVDIDLTPEALADALTMAGFEVEDIEDRRTWADGVVVGRVCDRQPHPDADKLSVCTVDIGAAEPSTIVCGAANVRADIWVAVAKVDTYLPVVDLKIKPRKLRGVPSSGMICSLAELGLAKESEGIHIFPEADLPVGADARPYLGLDDVVLDLTSTANRADALSLVGIAREVAAITGATLKLPQPPKAEIGPGEGLQVKLTEEKACPIYIGTTLSGVKIQPSPPWLQRRLQAAGTRPINNIVDITNYVLLEWGQPLHAFDRSRLHQAAGREDLTLGVRFAQAGETLKTLDGQVRSQLTPETLLITANDVPVALAGVMGGEDTEVHDGTTDLVLEAAYFDGAVIRRSGRSQGLRTEASARYERGVNPAELTLACDRALALMQELAGATLVTQTSDRTALGHISPTRTLSLRLARVQAILGPVRDESQPNGQGQITAADVETTLTKLGCTLSPTADGVWDVTVPAYRYRDLEREIDLIEEVARLYGYNNFCDTLPAETAAGVLSPEAVVFRQLRQCLRGAGLTELMHYSVTKPSDDRQVKLANPLFSEYSALRTNLLDGLIDAFQFNLEQGNGPLNGFEIGRIFWMAEGTLHEQEAVGGILGGDPRSGQWRDGSQPLDWYSAKGVLEAVFQRLGLAVDYRPEDDDPRLHPGRTAGLWVRGRQRLGYFGQIHPQVRQARDLPDAVYAFELDWAVLLACLRPQKGKALKFQPYSAYPASDRDIAFFAPVEVAVGELERAIAKSGGKLLESVTLFDQYQGDNVPDNQRSLAFRLVYRALDRTLTDADIDPVHAQVRQTLTKQFNVSLRS